MTNKIQAHIVGHIISTNDSLAYQLHDKSRFGERVRDKIQYSLVETLFLVNQNKLEVVQQNEQLSEQELQEKLQKID